MTRPSNGDGRGGESLGRLVVVRVEDAIEPKLAGRTGRSYESPPQTHDQAIALVSLLLGRATEVNREREWRAPIPGGRRVVTPETTDD